MVFTASIVGSAGFHGEGRWCSSQFPFEQQPHSCFFDERGRIAQTRGCKADQESTSHTVGVSRLIREDGHGQTRARLGSHVRVVQIGAILEQYALR